MTALGPVVLVHITTVPETLGFLGQIGAMRARGFEIHAVSSPGELLDEFAAPNRSQSTRSRCPVGSRPCAT